MSCFSGLNPNNCNTLLRDPSIIQQAFTYVLCHYVENLLRMGGVKS